MFSIIVTDAKHTPSPVTVVRTPIPPAPSCSTSPLLIGCKERETFSSKGSFDILLPGEAISKHFEDSTISAETEIMLAEIIGTTRRFDTELTKLEIDGTVDSIKIEMREHPTEKSSGETTIRALGSGALDGPFAIDSFFDVIVQLRVDPGTGFTDWVTCDPCPRVVLTPGPTPLALVSISVGLLAVGQAISARRSRARRSR